MSEIYTDFSEEYNLTVEFLQAFKDLCSDHKYINLLENDSDVVLAYKMNNSIQQRTILSVVVYRLLLSTNRKIPNEVRLSLAAATNTIEWLDAVKLAIIPFLNLNVEVIDAKQKKS